MEILGGADPVLDVLGYLPRSWRVIPFGAHGPPGISLHSWISLPITITRPGWRRSGATSWKQWPVVSRAILPPHFRPLFGDAAIYAEPAEVLSLRASAVWRPRSV